MTSAVVHSNRIEGAKEDKSVELEVKKFLITSKYNLINLVTRRFLRIFAANMRLFWINNAAKYKNFFIKIIA